MFPNKYEMGMREYLYKFIGAERYDRNQDVIERLGKSLVTENDFKAFMNLTVDIYEAAYMRAVEDYRKHFENLGVQVEVGTEVR